MIRKSASWALKPLQAPPPPEFPPPFPASGDGVVVPPALPRVSPGNGGFPRALPGAGRLCDGVWAVVVRRLRLSRREAQIIRCIVTELKDQAIAHELGISYNTLRTQLSRLYRKLGVRTRVGVAVAVFSEALRMIVDKQEQSAEDKQ